MSLQDRTNRSSNELAAQLHTARNGIALQERKGAYEITITRAQSGFMLEVKDVSQTGLKPERRIFQNAVDAARAFNSKARQLINLTTCNLRRPENSRETQPIRNHCD